MYRVDIFEYQGELKLNEIESFDADVRFSIKLVVIASSDF